MQINPPPLIKRVAVDRSAARRLVTRTLPSALILLGLLWLVACTGGRSAGDAVPRRDASAPDAVFEGPVTRAECGPGSTPETDIQGRVSIEDMESGRSLQGYACNLELTGQHAGTGANWQMAWYEDCAYYSTKFLGDGNSPGVQVIDVSDPANPRRTANLTTPAMLDPWESLKADERRGLLGAVAAWDGAGNGPVFFDLYDLTADCTQPQQQASTPLNIPIGHEGNFSVDGTIYYGSSLWANSIAAIDLTDPAAPELITVIPHDTHGLASNPEGDRLYLANFLTAGQTPQGNGLDILDASAIQARQTGAAAPLLGSVTWTDGSTAQHTIAITYEGRPHVVFVDEGGFGAARIIDVSDETSPRVISKLKLEVHMPENQSVAGVDCANETAFCYEGHYCGIDRVDDPTALACGYFKSGIRVFDIRDPLAPREIAYYVPPGRPDAGPGSQHQNGLLTVAGNDPRVDWCSAQVRFVPERGELWTTCQDNGFLVLRFTNGAWPFQD